MFIAHYERYIALAESKALSNFSGASSHIEGSDTMNSRKPTFPVMGKAICDGARFRPRLSTGLLFSRVKLYSEESRVVSLLLWESVLSSGAQSVCRADGLGSLLGF